MADVNLGIQVTSTGVQAAIDNINRLKRESLNTTPALGSLSREASKVMSSVTTQAGQVATATQKIKGYGEAMRVAGQATSVANKALAQQTKLYAAQARVDPNSTARSRLTRLGGQNGLQGGMSTALQEENRQLSKNASMVRDRQTVMREEAQLGEARMRRTSAQGEVEQANFENSLRGMTAQKRATAILTRAEGELANAKKAVERSDQRQRGASGLYRRQTAADINAQTAAQRQLAKATRSVGSAQKGVASANAAARNAQDPRSRGQQNAFQSSYSYFIVAGLATQASQAILGMGTAAVTASREIERSFADVVRTTEGTATQLTSLQGKLREVAASGPISMVDLSEIATLGNQLGVAAEDVEGFTDVISKYSAVSGQSAENAATAFGRISNLTGLAADQYSNLASAITYVARTTVATEGTIQNAAKEITALSAGSGFSADAIIGLAGALSSLAIPPERARGALSLYFGALNKAVSQGGPKLQAFAELTGRSADELENLVRQNQGQEVFTAFISGLADLDTVAKSTALDTLGLSTIRVDQTMRALSQNIPLVTSSLEGATRAFNENVEITNQYGIITGTLDSRIEQFGNTVELVSAAVGDLLAPVLKEALLQASKLLSDFSDFARSPIGKSVVGWVAAITTLLGVLAALIGVLALAKASLVVLGFAVSQMGWAGATNGLTGWIARLVSSDIATRRATRSMVEYKTALARTKVTLDKGAAGARLFGAAMNALNFIVWIAAIALVTTALTALWEEFLKIQDPSKRLTENLDGLRDALLADKNAESLADSVEELGVEVERTGGKPISDFNASLLAAIEIQKQAKGAFEDTNETIDAQAFSLGEASKEWIANELKSQDEIEALLNDETVSYGFRQLDKIDMSGFELLIEGPDGLDLNELSQTAILQSKEDAMVVAQAWATEWDKARPEQGGLAGEFVGDEMMLGGPGQGVVPKILDSVMDAFTKSSIAAALFSSKQEEAGGAAAVTESEFNTLSASGEEVIATFSGVTNRINDFRDAVQGAISGTVGFDSVLKAAQSAAKELAGDGDALPVDAAGFSKALTDSIGEAEKFYTDIMELADGGSSSFALQLAELGPEAQSILGSALDPANGDALGKLESDARFAAFLASDAFKNTLETEMMMSNQAYARIFRKTGDLGEVRKLIAAEVAGPEALKELEAQWAITNPSLLLNITPGLSNLDENEIQLLSDQLSGKIEITPIWGGPSNGAPQKIGQRVVDTITGAEVELPASFDNKTLAFSIAEWTKDQSLKPAELSAVLDEDGLSESLDGWVDRHGPITVRARIVPLNDRLLPSPTFPNEEYLLPSPTFGGAKGGEIPGFASGGGWGQFRGPGSGTSDSILARVSAGEFINTADSTKFWGPDFFDSLNRKMLPESFMNMLSSAAVSGNQGPQNVTNVNVTQVNPVTRNPLKQLREDSENLVTGMWA